MSDNKNYKDFKIIYLMPPQEKNGDFRDLRDFILDNQGLKSIIMSLNQKDYGAQFINADLLNMSLEQVIQILEYMGEADLLGISMVENNVEMVCRLLKILEERNYKTKVVVGGFFPTLCYEELMLKCPTIDYCIIGEGEKTMVDLVTALDNKESVKDISGLVYREDEKIIANPQEELDVTTLGFNYDLNLPYLIERGGSEYIFTSRGCNGNCKFCSIKAFYKYIPHNPWRELPIKKVVDKIEYLNKRWKQNIIPMWDDNFLSGKRGKERAYEFIEEIKKRDIHVKFFINCRVDDVDKELFEKLKEIGLYQVGLGIENMSEDVLRFYGKGTNVNKIRNALDILDKLELETCTSFIIFTPFSDLDEVNVNLQYFFERLEKENGSTYKNLLLPTISVLGLTRGARIINDKKVKEISYLKGFHYYYNMQDAKAEKLKRILLYLAQEWWQVYIVLIQLDNYVFHPYYLYYEKMENPEIISEYNELWKRLAYCHLNTYKKIINRIANDEDDMQDIFEYHGNEVNDLILSTKKFIEKNHFEDVFQKIQYFIFTKEDKYILFDITKSEFVEISQLQKEIIERYNYLNLGEIERELSNNYDTAEIEEEFNVIQKKIQEGSMLYPKEELKVNDIKKLIRKYRIIIKSKGIF